MFQLREHLSFCLCGDRVLFLDLAADRYFCLGSALERSFRTWIAGRVSEGEAAELRARGLLVPERTDRAAAEKSPAPRATGDFTHVREARHRGFAEPLAAELFASAWLRARPLRNVVRWCGKSRGHQISSTEAHDRAGAVVAGLARSAYLLGSRDRCLSRAVAAMIMSRRRRLDARLVFGVRVDPFAAHAWVQLDDRVLVGDFEQVRLFTPILSVP